MPFHVLIAAAGSGTRAGGTVPKQYAVIAGQTILRRTIEKFLHMPGLASLRVIISPEMLGLYNDATAGLNLPEPVTGGAERMQSVHNGLLSLSNICHPDDIVLIHDAARPFVNAADIARLLAVMQHERAATLSCPVADTLRRADTSGHAGEITERSGLWSILTPQAFRYADIMNAHFQTKAGASYTDDSAIASAAGIPVRLVESCRSNIKVTTPEDMQFARQLLGRENMETRIGTGFDVHAFSEGNGAGTIKLCGIDVPFDRSLAGHSDADVGLHALTDAILGALADGDIGSHFPPSDPAFKGMDSAIFLQKAVDLVKRRSGRIINLDLTLICEAPKVGPHRDSMRARIATICGIDTGRVAVKATTTEKLGFAGRGEGIAAQAAASISLPAGEE